MLHFITHIKCVSMYLAWHKRNLWPLGKKTLAQKHTIKRNYCWSRLERSGRNWMKWKYFIEEKEAEKKLCLYFMIFVRWLWVDQHEQNKKSSVYCNGLRFTIELDYFLHSIVKKAVSIRIRFIFTLKRFFSRDFFFLLRRDFCSRRLFF